MGKALRGFEPVLVIRQHRLPTLDEPIDDVVRHP
jgi:hypothetical protein